MLYIPNYVGIDEGNTFKWLVRPYIRRTRKNLNFKLAFQLWQFQTISKIENEGTQIQG